MPSFEWNKIIASVLTAMIIAMVTGIIASSFVRPRHLEKAAYLPPGAEEGAAATAAAAVGTCSAATVTRRSRSKASGPGASPAWATST